MPNCLSRAAAVIAAMLFAATPAATSAAAQDFLTRPITLIVPFLAGGTTDVTMRALAAAAEKQLGQPIVIENKPGAGGVLGPLQMAASAAPDGYTIAQIPTTVFRFPAMRKTSFDPANDLTYIIGLAGYTFGVVVKGDAPWKTFGEFLAYAKANPGTLNYGTPGTGTSLHITMEQIARAQGVRLTHVPYRGTPDTTNAVLGGHIQALADSSSWAPLVNTGELRLLVTWGAARSKSWPDVPTLKELGIDLVSDSPFGLAGPKGMDPKIVRVLHDAFRQALADPAFKDTMAKFDQEEVYSDSAGYRAFALRQIAEQKTLVEQLGLKAE